MDHSHSIDGGDFDVGDFGADHEIVDFHVHTAPSLMPRRHDDHTIADVLAELGVSRYVLKAHEGSTAERAQLVGGGAIGSVVLNSPVGGGNPDAVYVAAELGARVVWLPTISSVAHHASRTSAAVATQLHVDFSVVELFSDSVLLDRWYDVADVAARYDLVLASGHVSIDEAVAFFKVAKSRGVQRLLVTHPLAPFLGWRDEHVEELQALGAYLEVGVLADHITDAGPAEGPTAHLAEIYPSDLLVFGSDLGHTDFPSFAAGIRSWIQGMDDVIGSKRLERLLSANGRTLIDG